MESECTDINMQVLINYSGDFGSECEILSALAFVPFWAYRDEWLAGHLAFIPFVVAHSYPKCKIQASCFTVTNIWVADGVNGCT